jgi:hypothetical protein
MGPGGNWKACLRLALVSCPIAFYPASSLSEKVTTTAAEPNVTFYRLQKNCEKLAAETFRRESAHDEDRVGYRAHYNARLNKCFYAETYISPTPVGINRWVYLSDLQANRIYGGFHRSSNIGFFYCNLHHKECHSEAEWNELMKAYMED